jgi:hypothetical protein
MARNPLTRAGAWALGLVLTLGMTAPPGAAQGSAKWDAAHRDPFTDALQVWRLGKDYFEQSGHALWGDADKAGVFQGIDLDTGNFLAWPDLRPVVQSAGDATATPYEDALVEALKSGQPAPKLQALAVLLRVRSPSSVPEQWQALGQLRQIKDRPQWQPLLDEWQACFDPRRLEQTLQGSPPKSDRYNRNPDEYLWSIRAAGVIHDAGAMDRLAALSTAGRLSTSLAAERSLEDFSGPKANQALVRCVLGWQYDAYVRACDALLERDKALLTKVLLEAKPPKACRCYQGLFLARCDNAAAVPILCREVPACQGIDREMFAHVARLAGAEHRQAVESLPGSVRPEQRELAGHTVRRFNAKLKHRAEQTASPQGKAIVKIEDLGGEVVADEKSPETPVVKLDFSDYSPVKDDDLQYAAVFSRLRELNLRGTGIADAALAHIKGLARLESLDLSFTRLGDAGIKHLKGLSRLQTLSLRNTKITSAGLNDLEGMTQLQTLDLTCTKVGDAGLQHLRKLIQLQRLSLWGTAISDAGLENLSGLTQLQQLNLGSTAISDAGLKHLKSLAQLQDLGLGDTKVTDAGLEHLKGLGKLRSLDLLYAAVTDAGVKKLQAALPKCSIRH